MARNALCASFCCTVALVFFSSTRHLPDVEGPTFKAGGSKNPPLHYRAFDAFAEHKMAIFAEQLHSHRVTGKSDLRADDSDV